MSFERGPYLSLAVFCEKAIQSKEGLLSVINVADRFIISTSGPDAPEEMPRQTLPWTLVLAFKSGEAQGTLQVRITPELPSGLKLPAVSLPAHFEGKNRGVNLILATQVQLSEPGVYWFWVEVEDEFVTKVPVEVIYSRFATSAAPGL